MTLLMVPDKAEQLIWRLGCLPSGITFAEMKKIWSDDVSQKRLLEQLEDLNLVKKDGLSGEYKLTKKIREFAQ